jgi:hypothetical protein
MLNVTDRMTNKSILESLEQESPELVEQIRRLMFVFDDLLKLDDKSIQALLKEVENAQWALALKGASEDLRGKIMGNLSQRAAAMLQEEIQYLGPVRVSDVEAAQQAIVDTVRRLDPSGDDILFIAGSDHGMETISRAIDLDALLIAAGLKEGPGSRDVVVAPNGTAAALYFAEPEGSLVPRVARFLARENWVGEVFAGDKLASVGLPGDSAMRVAVTLAGEDRENPHGVRGYCPIVQDPADSESKIGFGQHGGLGPNEQRPFLMIEGGGFAPGPRRSPSSLVDIAPTVLRHLHMDHDDMDGHALPRAAD